MPAWVWTRRGFTGPQQSRQIAGAAALGAPGLLDAAGELPVLKALLRISEAVLRADYFDEVLEVIAEQALVALGAASLSISRWEPEQGVIRTLINVGELGPAEDRWPHNELYDVAGDRHVTELLQRGQSYTSAIDDPASDPECISMLRGLGKESELAVPVMHEDTMWGEIYATGGHGRRFGHDDAQLLQAIAAHTAVAIGRAELFSRVWRFAHQDPLTGLANRRALDRYLADIDWAKSAPVAMVCDLDGFKEINDRDGHAAGDAVLRTVAGVLDGLTAATAGAFAARMGGDEFCVLLSEATLKSAEVFAMAASAAIRRAVSGAITVSWGAAVPGPAERTGQDLVAAADAALLGAKRQGPARFNAEAIVSPAVPAGAERRGPGGRRAGRAVSRLLPRVARILRENGPLSVPDALEVLAVEIQFAVDTAAWSLSAVSADGTELSSIRSVDSVRDPGSGLSMLTTPGEVLYRLADYPASAQAVATGTAFIAGVDLDGSDPAETALLREIGYQAVLGVGVSSGSGDYLLEFYSHEGYSDLVAVAAHVEVLAHYCVARALSGGWPGVARRPGLTVENATTDG